MTSCNTHRADFRRNCGKRAIQSSGVKYNWVDERRTSRGVMAHSRSAVHRTILVVDVEGFGDPRRTNPHQVTVRDGLYRALRNVFDTADPAFSPE
jgi:hypothetical protein